MRHDVSRLERIMETLPIEARAEFGQNLAVALGDSYETLLGVDPALLAQKQTAKARDFGRSTPFGEQTQHLKTFLEEESQKQAGPLSKGQDHAMPNVLRRDQGGSKPGQPFGSFEGFKSF